MNDTTYTDQIWDDIVVGAGSSGAVLASRLSEDAGRRVLLLEAGPDFPEPEDLPAPLRNATEPQLSGFHWDYSANLRGGGLFADLLKSAGMLAAAPADTLTALRTVVTSGQPLAVSLQQFPYAQGKVVGGSSAINGALALRALQEDFDHWATLGNPEWAWPQVLPYFRKLETDNDFSGEVHGREGPIPVSRPREDALHSLQSAFRAACLWHGIPGIPDFNASSVPGVGCIPFNIADNTRISTALAYLAPARARPNLEIRADCAVHRILLEDGRATGVEFFSDGKNRTVRGKRVTVSAGAVNTIPILLRSGIGNSRLCRLLGITPVMDLHGVGENLSDHPAVILWMVPRPGICNAHEPNHQIMARVASNGTGVPDLSVFMLSSVDTGKIPKLKELLRTPRAAGISVMLSRPLSKGRVFLESAAPGSKPVIDLNLASAPEDMDVLMRGVRLAWKLARSSPLKEQIQSVFMWTDALVNNDHMLRSAISRLVGASWHATGTARMGPADDSHAVVDQHFRVHGIRGLRIVDASVMPAIPATPTNLTCIMLAERASDWMKQDDE